MVLELAIKPDNRGKVRNLYDLGDRLLLVTSDRISAFDYVLDQLIPYKGEVLNRLSLVWFDLLGNVVPNHLISADIADLPEKFQPFAAELDGRFMIVKKAKVFPIECIVRGYLVGSGWKEYQREGTVCGIVLPKGLREADKLDQPIFTPSTKAEIGDHDENISFERMVELIGETSANELRRISIEVYSRARDHAAECGLIIADTKFEFGTIDGWITLIDEVLTPDSSRFWPVDDYEPGRGQVSFDKQSVRDWLEGSGWDKQSVPPPLPQEVISATSARYIEAYELLVGDDFRPKSSD